MRLLDLLVKALLTNSILAINIQVNLHENLSNRNFNIDYFEYEENQEKIEDSFTLWK